MNDNKKVLLILGVVIIIVSLFAVGNILLQKIPSNDITVTGNTAGNLNNKGLFCEADGKVYFSNAYDNGCLYSMNSDETNLKKLTSSQTSMINAGGKYIYYFLDSSKNGAGLGFMRRNLGIYRSRLNGKKSVCLTKDISNVIQLSGDYLYYQHNDNVNFTQLYKLKTDKSENVLISESMLNPAACHNGTIYFNGTDKDHYLYALNTSNDSISTVYEGNLWYPAYHENYIYYMDVSSNYRLCRYSLSSQTQEVLTTDRVDTYNVGNSYVYYQTNSQTNPALMRMRLDGSEPEIVAEGIYQNINITSQYVYFNSYNQNFPVYRTPADGAVSVSEFSAAKAVLLDN